MWKYIIIPSSIHYLDEKDNECIDGWHAYGTDVLDESIKQSWYDSEITIIRTEDCKVYDYGNEEGKPDIWDDIEEWPYFVEEEKI